MRLLIVEDERAIAEVMMLNLKRVGYECEYAQDGEMGAAMVEKQSYDLVLLDIMLPKINGYELMEYLAQLQIPVIFITAKGSVQDRVKGLHMGADDYLVKPFAVDELTARVESVLRRYHKRFKIKISHCIAIRCMKRSGMRRSLNRHAPWICIYSVYARSWTGTG